MHESDKSEDKSVDDDFVQAEQYLDIKIPQELKNILKINGYYSLRMISEIKEDDIVQIEKFMRETVKAVIPKEEHINYFGLFHRYPDNFIIAPGHRKILTHLKKYYEVKKQSLMQAAKENISPSSRTHLSKDLSTKAQSSVSQEHILLSSSESNSSSANTSRFRSRSRSRSRSPLLVKDQNLTETNALIFSNLSSWIKLKCNSYTWNQVKDQVNNIRVCSKVNSDGTWAANIHCFCETAIRIFKVCVKQGRQEKWVYSNFHRHIIKHLNKPTSEHRKINKTNKIGEVSKNAYPRKKIVPITHFFPKCSNLSSDLFSDLSSDLLKKNSDSNLPTCSGKITILQDISINTHPNLSNNAGSCGEQSRKLYNTESTNGQTTLPAPTEMLGHSFEIGIEEEKNCTQNVGRDVDLDDDKTSSIMESKTSSTNEVRQEELKRKTKWSSHKYQRRERNRRKREKLDTEQSLITNYVSVVEKINSVMVDYQYADISKDFIRNIENSIHGCENEYPYKEQCKNTTDKTRHLLNLLIKISEQNVSRKKNGHIFNETIKKFSLYLFYIGGRMLYEILSSNMPGILPSISTLNRFADGDEVNLEEGVFDFEGLNRYLEIRGLPKVVWIGEDATRITSKIEYNPKTNKIMGFSLPLSKNGTPVIDKFTAISAKSIYEYFCTGEKANNAYAIMAQPLSHVAPSYCLCIFGTNSKFTYEDVINRWQYMVKEASKFGIKIIGFSSDGDSRLLKAMRVKSILPSTIVTQIPTKEWEWFQMSNMNLEAPCFVQDSIHIATKLRTRLIKPSIILPLGKYTASSSHLHILINEHSKDKHLLVSSDLRSEDKMNYLAAAKMFSQTVVDLLHQIPDSDGTREYLKIMRYSVSPFLDKKLSIEERIYRIWYAVFFLRLWRQWIAEHNDFIVSQNFISTNCYTAIELNAHTLLKLIRIFRCNSELTDDMFTVWLFSSQMCEKLFRATRSLTTTYSTVVNFSIKDIIQRITRITKINEVINDLSKEVTFPRQKYEKLEIQICQLENFDDKAIENIVKKAQSDAVEAARKLEINVERDYCNRLNLLPIKEFDEPNDFTTGTGGTEEDTSKETMPENDKKGEGTEIPSEHEENFDFDSILDLSQIKSISNALNVKDFSSKSANISCNSPFIEINIGKKHMVIKKSTFCWLLETKGERVSIDRLQRFVSRQRQNKLLKAQPTDFTNVNVVNIENIVSVGDWCIFEQDNSFIIEKSKNYLKGHVVGRILSFSYLSGTSKSRQYSLDTAPTSANMKKSNRGLGCYCSWYNIDLNGVFQNVQLQKKSFHNLAFYRATIDQRAIMVDSESSVISLQKAYLSKINEFLNIPHVSQKISNDASDSYSDSSSQSYEGSARGSDEGEIMECADNNYSSENESLLTNEVVHNENIPISQENYYAVFYDNKWFIGRVIQVITSNKYRIKFLKENLHEFYWPKDDDIDEVNKTHIIFGPIKMLGSHPLRIGEQIRAEIVKKFKEYKKICPKK